MTSTLGSPPSSEVPTRERRRPRHRPVDPLTRASATSDHPGSRPHHGAGRRDGADGVSRSAGSAGSAWSGPGTVRWVGVRLGDVALMQLLLVGLLGLVVVGDLVAGSGSDSLPVAADGLLLLVLTLAAAVGGRVPSRGWYASG